MVVTDSLVTDPLIDNSLPLPFFPLVLLRPATSPSHRTAAAAGPARPRVFTPDFTPDFHMCRV